MRGLPLSADVGGQPAFLDQDRAAPPGDGDGWWEADRTAGAAEDLLSLMREVQCGAGFPEDVAHLLSHADVGDPPLSSGAGHGVPSGLAELFFTTTRSTEDSQEDGEVEASVETQWGE